MNSEKSIYAQSDMREVDVENEVEVILVAVFPFFGDRPRASTNSEMPSTCSGTSEKAIEVSCCWVFCCWRAESIVLCILKGGGV